MEPRDDGPGFADFMAQRSPSLLKFAMTLTGEYHRAEDLVSDVLGRAFERWAVIGSTVSAAGYVRKMVLNEYLATGRRAARWSRLRQLQPPSAPTRDPSADVDDREVMIARLAVLPDRQRAVIVLRYYLDLPDTEIAEALGCREATVRSHAARALTTLRVEIHTEPGDGDPTPDLPVSGEPRPGRL